MRDDKLFLDVSGFNGVRDQGPALVHLVTHVFQDVILPIDPELAMVGVVLFNESGSSKRVAKFAAHDWEAWIQTLQGNWEKASAVYAVHSDETLRGTSTAPERLALGAGLTPDSYGLVSFTVSVSVNLVPDSQFQQVQEALVRVAKEAFDVYDAPVGYITKDKLNAQPNGGVSSPYELATGITEVRASKNFAHQARGYYWGNFLTAGHVRALGGLDRVLAEAPCARVEVLDPEKETLYCQLTDSLEDIPLDKLRALHDYLKPVLRTGEFTSWVKRFRLVENPDPELWGAVSSIASEPEPKTVTRSAPRSQMTGTTGRHEAREWLRANQNPSALAGNRFSSTQEALAFVERLYEAGAIEVAVTDELAEPRRIARDGGPYATSLLVTLPSDASRRRKLFAIAAAEISALGLGTYGDEGQREILLWWD